VRLYSWCSSNNLISSRHSSIDVLHRYAHSARIGEQQRREDHAKTRSDMIMKYFSEKVSPGVHDVAAKKEGFGEWKEQFLHSLYMLREEKIREEEAMARGEKVHEVIQGHMQTRSHIVVKYSTIILQHMFVKYKIN
jgi:hypothetical protein